ncbi:MAG: polyprenyl synthetase family protein [Paracoccaceae bacterium]|jgi:geranylgeranyl diphosphate synthase type II
MTISTRIETALRQALQFDQTAHAPQQLLAAIDHAVFPGGARIRPMILTSVALACGDDTPPLTNAAACALEMIHCASLVHDDLPCFDDADMRRGKATVHTAYSQPLAVLAGDSLIVEAFAHLTKAAAVNPVRGLALMEILAKRTGAPYGICAGQGWESEETIDIRAYHASKTGALFIAATQMGAAAAGQDPKEWYELGARIGEAFQVADDLRDVLNTEDELGKPVGQDAAHARPNIVAERGMSGAIEHLDNILVGVIASIPSCPGEAKLAQMVQMQAKAMVPNHDITQRS